MSEVSEIRNRVVKPVLVDIEGEVPKTEIEQNEAKENFRQMMRQLQRDPQFFKLPVPLWYKEENKELYGEKEARGQMNFEYAVKSATIEHPEERAKLFVDRIQKVQQDISQNLFSLPISNGEDRGSEDKSSNVEVEEIKENEDR